MTPELTKGSHDSGEKKTALVSRNTKTDGYSTDLNKLFNNPSQTSLEKQIMLRQHPLNEDGSMMSLAISVGD